MKKLAVIIVAICLSGCAMLAHVEQPKPEMADQHFQKYDAYEAEKNTGNNQQ